MLVNGGVDLRLSPKLRSSPTCRTSPCRSRRSCASCCARRRNRLRGRHDRLDIGAGAKLRPFVNENLFVVLGFSLLKPGDGLASALGSTQPLHSFVGAIQRGLLKRL
jgi:hypothetical protein